MAVFGLRYLFGFVSNPSPPPATSPLSSCAQAQFQAEVSGAMDDENMDEEGLTEDQQKDLKAIRARKRVRPVSVCLSEGGGRISDGA